VPFCDGQVLPQPAQLVTVPSGVSQPLPALKSQSAKPALQAIWHAPPTQLGTPFADEQAPPQAPQLAVVPRAGSQPSTCLLPSQSAKRVAHTPLQVPLEQVRTAT